MYAATVSKMFDPPEGQAPYTYVFDFTGEVRHDRPDMVRFSLRCAGVPRDVQVYVLSDAEYFVV